VAAFTLEAQVAQRGKKTFLSSAVEGLAMNSFQTSTSCVFQVCYKLHQENMSDGSADCTDLQSTWQRP